MASLPNVVQRQGVKVSKSTRNWLMVVGLTSDDDSVDEYDLSDYAQSSIQQVLARVPGVGEVETFSYQYSMRVWLDPERLTDYSLTVEDVTRALQAYNVEVSAGQFGGAPAAKGQRLNASIIVQTLLKTPEEFGAIPLRTNPDGSIIRVRDVGRTELGTEKYGLRTLYNGRPATSLPIRLAPGRQCAGNGRCGQGQDGGTLQVLSSRHEGNIPVRHNALRESSHRRGGQDPI